MRAVPAIRAAVALASAATLVTAVAVTLARPSEAGTVAASTAGPPSGPPSTGISTAVSTGTSTSASTAASIAASASASAPRVATLVTGERVVLTRPDAGHVSAALEGAGGGGRSHRFQTLVTPTAQYVVPDEVLPYVGHQLDLSLFDVLAPPSDVTVDWVQGAAVHDVPGLTLPSRAGATPTTSGATTSGGTASGGTASAARVTSRPAFGAALAAGPGALRGVRTIRAAAGSGAAASQPATARPQYNLATLVVTGLDRRGAAASSGSVSVINADDAYRFVSLSSFFEGAVAFSVPEGTYSLSVTVSTPGEDGAAGVDSLVVLPEVTVTAPRTALTIDARTATTLVPVPATPRPSSAQQVLATVHRVTGSGQQASFTTGYIGEPPALYVTPVPAVKLGALHWYTYFQLAGTSSAADLPYVYDLEYPSDGSIPDRFASTVDASSLATLDARYYSDTSQAVDTYRGSFLPWETFSFRPSSRATAPLHRTEYVAADPDVAWVGSVVWRAEEFNGVTQGPRTVYRAGESRRDPYLRAPLVPGDDPGTLQPVPCTACRQGNVLALAVRPWADGGGHAVALEPSTSLDVSSQARLYADGTLVQQSQVPTGQVVVPATAGAFRLTVDTAKSATWTTTGTRTSTTWSWHRGNGPGPLPAARTCPDGSHACGFEPLLFADYDLGTDLTNALPAGRAATVSVRVHRQAFDTTPAVTALTLDVSADDGATWTPVTVEAGDGGTFTATVPAGQVTAAGGFLSLRAHASTALGEALDQTIVRAARVTREG